MDRTTDSIVSFILDLSEKKISSHTMHQTKMRLMDALACALGGLNSPPALIACRLAQQIQSKAPAQVWGSGQASSMEMAAFANAVMVRYLDYNDTYISKGSGHPSDMIAGLIAVAQAERCSGSALLVATVVAYEVFTALADVIGIRDLGWDQGFFVVLGATAGVSKLMNLNREQTADALAIAVSANLPTRQTRSGQLSMWKGVATAWSVRAAISACLLAKEGMSGPTAAFEGRHGVFDQITGPFELQLGAKADFGIDRTAIKFFPSEYHSQVPLAMALELRKEVPWSHIAEIQVQTYYTAYSEIGSELEKWHPTTRETADHSLPYLLSLALVDARINQDSFTMEKMKDPVLVDLMSRIKISENKDFTAAYPHQLITQIDIVDKRGARFTKTAHYPKGHEKNPMTDEQIEWKFAMLADALMPTQQKAALLTEIKALDDRKSIDDLMRRMVFESR